MEVDEKRQQPEHHPQAVTAEESIVTDRLTGAVNTGQASAPLTQPAARR